MSKWIKIDYKNNKTLPPLKKPILVALQGVVTGIIVYEVLKRVKKDDHDWEFFCDNSEISNAFDVIAWTRIPPFIKN